jgi:hypothetical protein
MSELDNNASMEEDAPNGTVVAKTDKISCKTFI